MTSPTKRRGGRTPIAPEVRERIIELHGRGMTRNAIAAELDVSGATVTKVCVAAGLSFNRTATKAATEAVSADAARRRAALSARLLDVAARALDDMDQPHLVFSFGGKDNTYNERELSTPPTGDRRNLMQIAGNAITRHLDIERHDSGAEGEAASVLAELMLGIKTAVQLGNAAEQGENGA